MRVKMDPRVTVADVIFGARAGGAEAQYTYLLPFQAKRGDLVLAPLSNRQLVGVVCRTYSASEGDLDFPLEKLKPVDAPISGLALPEPLVDMLEYVSSAYLSPLSAAIGAALPPHIGDRLVATWRLPADPPPANHLALTPLQSELLEAVRAGAGTLKLSKSAPPAHRKALRLLEAKGLLAQAIEIDWDLSSKPATFYRLTSDEAAVENYLREHARKRPAQALTLLKLRESEAHTVSFEDIKSLGGVTQSVVKSLVEDGLLEPYKPNRLSHTAAPHPNSAQTNAISALTAAIQTSTPTGHLLFGVTGSGKTEVYLRAAAEALRKGRQVLYLVPEIALATQAISHLRERFGERVAVMHSELNPSERLSNWIRVAEGKAPIVIGARSALFAPLSNLGLIVMDEEHESSYKQEASPRYHAKALVQFLARRHSCPYVLGSATPSLESYYEAQTEKLNLLELPARAASAALPEVEIEDLGDGYRTGNPSLLTNRLHQLLEETVQARRQAILFLNRRAYAPFLVCRECGHFFTCPRCAVTLTYSRKHVRLQCHHCGYQVRPPDICPQCKGNRIHPVGVGTEKVEEAVKASVPNAVVERLDRDVAQRKGALESILARFGAGEIDVLVGTQIVAKGLNFPNVTLVGVVAADVSLNLPDFRATERTFQLLSQVAGRAGRGSAAGRVVIQTFSPSHIAVQAASRHDYRDFYDQVITERRDAGYPPFKDLVNIVFSSPEYAHVVQTAQAWSRRLAAELPEAEVLGPAQCVLERLQNKWRWHILLKCPLGTSLEPLAKIERDLDSPKVQVLIDVDPHALM